MTYRFAIIFHRQMTRYQFGHTSTILSDAGRICSSSILFYNLLHSKQQHEMIAHKIDIYFTYITVHTITQQYCSSMYHISLLQIELILCM